jgi:hypothetical protein
MGGTNDLFFYFIGFSLGYAIGHSSGKTECKRSNNHFYQTTVPKSNFDRIKIQFDVYKNYIEYKGLKNDLDVYIEEQKEQKEKQNDNNE